MTGLRYPEVHDGYWMPDADPMMHVGTFARGQAWGGNGVILIWSTKAVGSFADGQATTRRPNV